MNQTAYVSVMVLGGLLVALILINLAARRAWALLTIATITGTASGTAGFLVAEHFTLTL